VNATGDAPIANIPPHVSGGQHVLLVSGSLYDAPFTSSEALRLGPTPCELTAWHSSSSISCHVALRCTAYACGSEVLGSYGELPLVDTASSSSGTSGGQGDARPLASVKVDAPAIDSVGVDERLDDDEAWEESGHDYWGGCASYAAGGINHGWCVWDAACNYCRESCWEECSSRALSNTPALSPTLLVVYRAAASGAVQLEALSAWDDASQPAFFLERAPLPGFLEVRGTSLGHDDWTPGLALGGSTCESTRWLSASSLMCKHSSGRRRSLAAVVSLVAVPGSFSNGYSYDIPAVSGVAPRNQPATGSALVTVRGVNFASAFYSLAVSSGGSAAEASAWHSDSSVRGMAAAARPAGANTVAVTAGEQVGSRPREARTDAAALALHHARQFEQLLGAEAAAACLANLSRNASGALPNLSAPICGNVSSSAAAACGPGGWGCDCRARCGDFTNCSGHGRCAISPRDSAHDATCVCDTGWRGPRCNSSWDELAWQRARFSACVLDASLTRLVFNATPHDLAARRVANIAPPGAAADRRLLHLAGANLGTTGSSVQVRLGGSAAEVTRWSSDSGLTARAAVGSSGSLRIYLTAAAPRLSASASTLTDAASYDDPWLSVLTRSNAPTTGQVSMSVWGGGLSAADYSPSFRVVALHAPAHVS